ncbi:hypothetical protein EXIGUO8H_420004 [Exiguobacterium sp. 8H]|uniref:hypothetical protein n=1 Tax=unclassified Exiguobacterium TaxID=2644629 RepID=UPI0012F0E17E|nr:MULTISPECIES: hypothetical protein [unclassified Exiguobacterium]VXC03995.1 hypothetical protein EXIGUO8H_420004 [Exiguobacterium sp. 8H]
MDERLLDDYAFGGLDPFVQTVFSELMARPEWIRVVDREHCVEKVVRFDEGRNSPYFRVVIYLDAEERPINKVYLYGHGWWRMETSASSSQSYHRVHSNMK